MYKIIRQIFSPYIFARFRPWIWNKMCNKQSSPDAVIFKPIIFSKRSVIWGKGVSILHHARIECVYKYENIEYTPCIILHECVSIQQNCHITCAEKIEIGKNTAIASNVTITDIDHPYKDINIPIECQELIVKPVRIGEDCKIYNNAVILQGTIIGNHCVVGANSVVKGRFPDYSIIVGVPARIVKRYNFEKNRWEETFPNGTFKE